MKFSDILILAVVLGGGYTYFFSEKESPTVNEKLIAQFDKHSVIKQDSWEKGKIIGGVQIYSVRKDYTIFQSIWSLGKDEASVMVLTEGKTPDFEAAFALSQCNQLAKAVTDNEGPTVTDNVSSIFKKTLAAEKGKDGVLRSFGDVEGKIYNASVLAIGSAITFSCSIKTA